MKPSRPRHRSESDRGAAFLEFALVLPILALLAMGIVEYGMAWKATNDVNAAARDAARVGTRAPAYKHADRDIVRQVAVALYGDKERVVVDRLVVYRANGSNDTKPPQACLTGDIDGTGPYGSSTCNVYGPAQIKWVAENLDNDANFTASGSCGFNWDRSWCPTSRNNNVATDNLDWLGVYIVAEHKSFTNFGFGDQTIRRGAVFRIEPAYQID